MSINNDEKSKERKSFELFDNFIRNIPQEKIKFDEFSMLEEITNAKINYNLMLTTKLYISYYQNTLC